jgi:hypothetical protein
MRRLVFLAAAVAALALASTAAAALVPWTFVGTGASCPVVSTYSNGVLHLEKNCATTTNASAGASITGLDGQTFSSASFTLANASQCQGGSPRFNVASSNGTTYFLGCNNVTPTTNADGSVTYTFTPATIAAAGGQVAFPSGTIKTVDVLIDVQGTADVSQITVNGTAEVPVPTGHGHGHGNGHSSKNECKKGGWKSFSSPTFQNQGQCVSWFNHHH